MLSLILSSGALYWISLVLKFVLILLLFRAAIWVFFWLLKKFLGVSVSATSWSFLHPGHISLAVRTTNLELHFSNIHLSLRLFDSSCHHFFRIVVDGIHVEYYHSSLVQSQPRSEGRAGFKPLKRVARALRLGKLGFWCLNQLFRLVEVYVECLEAWLEEESSETTSFIWTVQVSGHLCLIVKPLRKKELAVVFDVGGADVQFLMKSDTPCPSTEDGMYPLGKAEFCSKLRVCLQPLALETGGRVRSMQISTLPLTLDLHHEDAVISFIKFISSLSGRSKRQQLEATTQTKLKNQKNHLPEIEMMFEDVSLHYHASLKDRQLTLKMTRVSADAKTCCSSQEGSGREDAHHLEATVNIQGVSLNDSLRRKCVDLKQVLVHAERAEGVVSSQLQLRSLHASLWEEETVFWCRHIASDLTKLSSLPRSQPAISAAVSSSSRNSGEEGTLDHSPNTESPMPTFPISVVTSVEASDWSVQVRMSPPFLQSKAPVVRGVMASSVGQVQWSPMGDHTSSSSIRASVMVSDSYLQVPGCHPMLDNPAFFYQRSDDPSVLPSLRKHLWGRVMSLGRLALQLEKKGTILSHEQGGKSDDGGEGCGDSGRGGVLLLNGEGSGFMLEWSQPTVAMVTKILDHCRMEYWSHTNNSSSGASSSSSSKSTLTSSFLSRLSPSLQLVFQVIDVNVFVYGMTPDPPCVMLRLDAASLSVPTSSSTNTTPTSPSNQTTPPCSDDSSGLSPLTASFNLHNLLLDSLHLQDPDVPFCCSTVSNLAHGDGVAYLERASLCYDRETENVDMDVKKVWLSWDPTHHLCLFHTASLVMEDLLMLRGSLSTASTGSSPSTGPSLSSSSAACHEPGSKEVVLLGSKIRGLLARVPVSVTVGLERVEATAQVDRNARVSMIFDKSEIAVNGGVAVSHCFHCEVLFDKNRIVSVDRLIGRFPQDIAAGETPSGRETFKSRMEVEINDVLHIEAAQVKAMFCHGYYFNKTLEKVINVRKFLQVIHSGASGRPAEAASASATPATVDRAVVWPDVQLECGEFVIQICDDPFEVKLRANYELLCDEHEEKTQRDQALFRKIDQVKKELGEYAISGRGTQEFYDALKLENSKIYISRARDMYDSMNMNMEDVSMFLFSMTGVKLQVMSDPSMLGREKLVANITEMDSISPLPENYQFSTLWGGYVSGKADTLELQVRDYPYSVVVIDDVAASGRIVFAEQEAQHREVREAVVHVDKPWGDVTIQRKLPPLKYYYDLEITSSLWSMAYGPCLEPGLAQANNSFNLLTSVQVDPSKPLAYWDKLRLLFHGNIHLVTKELKVILPSTFDPYNQVEYLELKLTGVDGQLLTNTKLTLSGAAQLLVHTASKYDECELFSLPNVSACINLHWCVAGGDPNRHHHVVRCAPDRLPIRSDKQEHDSYGGFRSYNLDLEFSVDVKPPPCNKGSPLPSILLYSSTLRSLQQYQMLMKWNVTRPTKRGKYFNNVKPRRPPLLRHWRNVKVSASFPKMLLRYWSSQALQRGVECHVEEARLSLSLNLTLVALKSTLTQRMRANWTVQSLDARAKGIVAHIKSRTDITANSALREEDEVYVFTDASSSHDASMLLAIDKVTYSRQDASAAEKTEYTHKLETTDSRLLWNSSNRDVVLGLYDSFKLKQELKRYLSTEALKSVLSKKELNMEKELNLLSADKEDVKDGAPPVSSPRVLQSSSGNTMLDQLLQDIGNQYVKYVDERAPSDPQLKGISAINMDDITDSNWLITLVNTQVVLQGVEQRGYVLASSHLTDVIGCDHSPKMKNGIHVSKKSWVAKMQDLQYFTTQSLKDEDILYVPWLPLSVISRPRIVKGDQNYNKMEADREANLNALLGTLGPEEEKKKSFVPFGEAVGGTVSAVRMSDLDEEEGGRGTDSDGSAHPAIQLQRVAPRCHCQVIYVTYGDQVEAEINRAASPTHSASPPRSGLLSGSGDVDTFTFRYPSVEVHTTSNQYSLIMDIINNLLLHKESKKKEESSRQLRMQFSLQLSSTVENPRKAVLLQQNKVKKCLQAQREAETEYYLEQKMGRNPEKLKKLEEFLAVSKEALSQSSLKLSVLVNTFRQSRLYATPSSSQSISSEPMRRIEIWVDDTHWTLTHSDGQLRLADIQFTNFSYNRMTFTDDSGEHRLELGAFKVQNLMPNMPQVYQQVLMPYDPNEKHLRVDKNVMLRVYCKDKAPVAGISVKEHLEVNVVPLTVRLTSRFYNTMQDFFFPKAVDLPDVPESDSSILFGSYGAEQSSATSDGTDGSNLFLSRGSSLRRSTLSMSPSMSSTRSSSNYSPPPSASSFDLRKLDDVEKMKHRANKTKTFIYVKIPQTTLCVTYKDENVSIKDLQNQRLTVPTLEYHNKNWTWTDMLLEVKRDFKRAIVGQTIKSVIGMKGSSDEVSGLASPKISRHADIIFGHHSPTAQGKSGKPKRVFSRKADKDGDENSQKKEKKSSPQSPSKSKYQPPLTDVDITLKRSPRSLSKQSHSFDLNL